jgi:serine protease inhibitor
LIAEVVSEATKFILVNVLYFNAEWEKAFTKSRRGRFYVTSQSRVNVTMMQVTGQFRAGQMDELGAKAIEMPHKGHEVK